MSRAHARCWDGHEQVYQHICMKPTGQACVELGCDQPAGTFWTPHWCPEHDVERQDRISYQLDNMARSRVWPK